MSKRKISKQQLSRIQARQEKLKDSVLPTQEKQLRGQVIAHHGKYADVKKDKVIYHCKLRQNLGSLVVGDNILFQLKKTKEEQDEIGVVTAIEDRKSKIWRLDERGHEKLIAANVDRIYIVIAPNPEPSWLLVDSYLAAAHSLSIEAKILFNKIDLLTKHFQNQLLIYKNLGVSYLETSVLSQQGIPELVDDIAQHCVVFVGQSGVGKSSLIKTLVPEEKIAIGNLHETTGLGTHKTSTARLYELANGGKLIDSPGIREFNLWPMSAVELSKAFIEFQPYVGQCKFRDCTHAHEPDCAILKAVEQNKISKSRLANFHTLLENFKEL